MGRVVFLSEGEEGERRMITRARVITGQGERARVITEEGKGGREIGKYLERYERYG